MKPKIKRYLAGKSPSTFKVVGVLIAQPEFNVFTGNKGLNVDCKIGSKTKPLDITPFLEQLYTH